MKKIIRSISLFILALSLCACASVTTSATPAPNLSPTPTFGASVSLLPSADISTMPCAFVPDTNIPDVVFSPESFVVSSGKEICEDAHYLCYILDGIHIIDKVTGQDLRIPGYGPYTLYGGKVYYADGGWIQSYDIATGENIRMLAADNEVLSLLGYENRLYYSYCVNEDFEGAYDIYSIDLNGEDRQPFGPKGVDIFCFAHGKLYYDTPDELPQVFEYNLQSGKATMLCESQSQYSPFQIVGNMLYYADFEGGLISVIDLDTKETSIVTDDSCDFALFGQYVIYITYEAESGVLCAYDTGTHQTYKLLQLSGINDALLYSTPYGAYISVCTDEFTEPQRIVISGGKASLESISEATNAGG